MTREGPFWDVMEGRAAPPAVTLLGWKLVWPSGPGRPAPYQWSRCTTSPNGRRSGLRTGVSGLSAG